jgi:hypothetical protein
MRKLNFESENLLVDWIGFNIQGLIDRKQVKQIANYLFRAFGFNSTIIKSINGKWRSESLNYDRQNQFQLITKSGITQKIDKLIPLIIGQSKTICFYEKL